MSFDPNPTEPAAQPAGWYPDASGQQRYWDGAQWTEHTAAAQGMQVSGQQAYAGGASTNDERTMATLAHVLGIFAGFIGPLIIMLVKGDESVFVKHHAVEALNFAITVTIAAFVSAVLILLLIGLILLPAVIIGALVLQIMAAMAANRGEWYRYPMTLRLITGPAV